VILHILDDFVYQKNVAPYGATFEDGYRGGVRLRCDPGIGSSSLASGHQALTFSASSFSENKRIR
jgi:hypothetical protein